MGFVANNVLKWNDKCNHKMQLLVLRKDCDQYSQVKRYTLLMPICLIIIICCTLYI